MFAKVHSMIRHKIHKQKQVENTAYKKTEIKPN